MAQPHPPRQNAAIATRPLWRNADYLVLWIGQSVSAVGTQASQLALPLLILAVTGSPAQAGLLGGLRGLAYILFGLPAGALVDRWNRRWVMVLSDACRALAFASIPLALLAGRLTSAQLYAVSFIEGTLFIFFGLAETACLTRVVAASQLPTAISGNQATEAASILVGPPLGGALFGISRALPFVADAVSYAISAISILFIRAGLQQDRTGARRTLRLEIGEAMRWIWQRAPLRLMLWLNLGINLIFGGWTLTTIELAQRLGAGSAAIGLVFAAGGVGTILGTFATPSLQRRWNAGAIVTICVWLFALTWPPYALASSVFFLGLVNAIGFLVVPIGFGTMISYRLLLTPDVLQGRINSVFRLAGFGGQTAGFLLTGLLLEWRGPVATVWITFIPAVALAVLATASPSLRGVGRLHRVTNVVALGGPAEGER